jgi:glycosyltransferase involved in cell wall biosynthesis
MENSVPQRMAWIACQLGAREHYSIPRALHRRGLLQSLVTDVWVGTRSGRRYFPVRRWRDRSASDIPTALVRSFTTEAAIFEASRRLAKMHGWRLIVARNRWFQDRVIATMRAAGIAAPGDEQRACFSYSYTARGPFQLAKQRGWKTVLGQIDPGPVEERIVATLYENTPEARGTWEPAPTEYWEEWREECELADHIVVNSLWSQRALVDDGVSPDKIRVIPLAYDPPEASRDFVRSYPSVFSRSRPMRVLFLGQANLRKGTSVLIDVMRRMRQAEVEFWIVGDVSVPVPVSVQSQENIRWVGSVPRSEAQNYYREADVFVLPTYSDGFALTQLEAQAWKLPLITSPYCGDVVRNGRNGILFSTVTADALEFALDRLSKDPSQLLAMSQESRVEERFSLSALSQALSELGDCKSC